MIMVPSATVIVPFLNPGPQFKELLDSLVALDYPREQLEIFLVDNGCTDGSPELATGYPFTVLQMHAVKNSYAARNVAIKAATGSILAFTDADCTVDLQWLRRGIECMADQDATLVGGRIRFTLSDGGTPAEYFDALTHMHNKSLVETQGSSVTANLLAKREAFEVVGLFPEEVGSGGDRAWTKQATGQGLRLVYCSEAVVYHPARRFGELLRKAWRVGSGYAAQAPPERSYGSMIRKISHSLRPGSPRWIRGLIHDRGEPEMAEKVLQILAVAYVYGLVWAAGALRSVAGVMLKGRGS